MRKLFMQMIAVTLTLAIPRAAYAGWGQVQETIAGHQTWVFTPDTPLSANTKILNGKRALIISLHGCDQDGTKLKQFGNWDPTAKDYGLVVAVPDVGAKQVGPGCWDYDSAADKHENARDIMKIAADLKQRENLQIDPNQIYITGLSSGAAMALEVACTAPDVFAGVGAVAGPSVGSDQNGAFNPPPLGNVEHALAKCKSLSGGNPGSFDNQIASVVYGELDKHDSNICAFSRQAGKKCLVPVEWTLDNAQVLSKLYQCAPVNPKTISSGMAEEQLCLLGDGKAVGSLLRLFNVGRAWPAGSGDTSSGGGDWINKADFNYPAYVTQWFFASNRRVTRNVPPIIDDISTAVNGTSIIVTGSASDPDANDKVTEVLAKLDGQFPQAAQKASGSSSWSASFANVKNDACYTPVVTARDSKGAIGEAAGQPVKVGNPPTQPPTVSALQVSSQDNSITVSGTAASACAAVNKVEVELDDRGFQSAVIRGQIFEYRIENLPGGVYTTRVKVTDSDGQSATVSGSTVTILAFEAANGTGIEHMNAGRIRVQSSPCPSVGFGACDRPFQTLFSEHQFSPFDLFKAPAANEWYADPANMPPT